MTSNALEDMWHEHLSRLVTEWTRAEREWRKSLETPQGAVYVRDGSAEAVAIGAGDETMYSDVTVHTEHYR